MVSFDGGVESINIPCQYWEVGGDSFHLGMAEILKQEFLYLIV
jgi:hypothetical protein